MQGLRTRPPLLLSVPHHNLNFGSRAFRVSARPKIGNILPPSVCDCKSLDFQPLTNIEVEQLLRNTKLTAAGCDDIPAWLLYAVAPSSWPMSLHMYSIVLLVQALYQAAG